jgi:hypothetical protein
MSKKWEQDGKTAEWENLKWSVKTLILRQNKERIKKALLNVNATFIGSY